MEDNITYQSFDGILQAIQANLNRNKVHTDMDALTTVTKPLVNFIRQTGQTSSDVLKADNTIQTSNKPHYVTNFLWSENIKSFLLLWRDILFQNSKADLLHTAKEVSDYDVLHLREKTNTTLAQAMESLHNFVPKHLDQVEEGQYKKWRLQKNPWSVYDEQIQAIESQIDKIQTQHPILLNINNQLEAIRQLVHQNLKQCNDQIQQLKATASETKDYILEHISEAVYRPSRVVNKLDQATMDIPVATLLSFYANAVERAVEKLPEKTNLVVGTLEGMLQTKEINFKRLVKIWIDTEISPLLYENWEQAQNISNSLKMSLVNIRNRAILLANEAKEGKSPNPSVNLTQPLEGFLQKTKNTEEDIQKLQDQIQDRLQKEFRISAIYEKDFLNLPLQSSINQLRNSQDRIYNNYRHWIYTPIQNIRRFWESVEEEDNLSPSEKIVRYIKNYTEQADNSSYLNIFMTKGYIGESFWVGRKDKIQHAERIIDNWKLGFRGALLISGQRFSGKTLFGETIANRFFPNHIIRLIPEQSFEVNGHKLFPDKNLSKALDFIKKYIGQQSHLIWIDDLELWQDLETPIQKDVQALEQFIDTFSNRHFVMVATNNWVKTRLNRVYNFEEVFQSHINMDSMSPPEIAEAVLIRHGATHKTLVNENGEELDSSAFQKVIQRISTKREGNIGDVLFRWASSTKIIDEESVQFVAPSNHPFPDFMDSDTAVILAAIMMEKETDDYQLRKRFGPAFSNKYKNIIQRLLSIGILKRKTDGTLFINDIVVNDIGKLLEKHAYLKFYK